MLAAKKRGEEGMKRFRLLAAYAAVFAMVLVIPRVAPAQDRPERGVTRLAPDPLALAEAAELPLWDFTVSTYGGVSIPSDTDIDRMDSLFEGQDGELSLSDVDLNTSAAFGGKLGV